MEAAELLFAEKGFAGSSVREIADNAGVDLAMINYYFGTKEKLMEALFTYRGEAMKMHFETMLNDKNTSHIEKVYRLIDHYIDKLMGQQCFHKIMAREQLVGIDSSISQLIRQLKTNNQKLVKELISDGQKAGVFKKNIDIPLMMATLIGTVSHFINTQHYYREMNHLQDMEENEFQQHLKKKISHHLKNIFKATITNEK